MTRVFAIGLFAVLVLMSRGVNASPLDSYRWKARPLIVFGSGDGGAFGEQLDILNRSSAGLRERDIVLIPVPDGGTRQDLRRAYSVTGSNFEVVLVGKDGGVKLRSKDLVSPEEIFRLVDAMPMRRDEMRRR